MLGAALLRSRQGVTADEMHAPWQLSLKAVNDSGFSAADIREDGTGGTNAGCNANLLGNQKDGALKAVSTYVKKGRTVSVVRTMVYGADEKLIADVTTSHVLSK